jgi:hypothetical protein
MRTRPFVGPVFLAAVCLPAGACSWLASGPAAESGPEPTATATDEEAGALAVELERAVQSRSRERALQAFALEVVAYRAVDALPMAADKKPEILKLVPGKVEAHGLVNLMVTEGARPGGFKLIRVRPIGDRHVATFRVTIGEIVPLFLDVRIARFPGGRVGVEDLFCVNDGEELGAAARRSLLPAATLRDPGLKDRLGEEDRLSLTHADKLDEFGKAFRDRRWKKVVSVYDGLPVELRERKTTLVQYGAACVRGGMGSRADAALAVARRRFPGDPAVDLLATGYHLAREEYAATCRALDALRSSIGEDAMINAIQSMTFMKRGQLPAATAAADRALAADPELRLACLCRVDVAAAARNHADTLTWLKRTVERTGHDFGDLRADPDFAAFVESPQFAEWQTWRANWPPR